MNTSKLKLIILCIPFFILMYLSNILQSSLLSYAGIIWLSIICFWCGWQVGIKKDYKILIVDYGKTWRKSVTALFFIVGFLIIAMSIFFYFTNTVFY